ncbi:filamentous hemagglutinin N-terminal domain-containing protein [Asaia siamensis]|uniref:Filamentous haemagglutinin FhaB/tRNA nuclease CdiA-like TPS domain-containing protein n=1 Tax=Asaia siamensis TaxID=110479 RepID=A0ABQ1M0F1_9PROT|nr:GLUG motif-containing protein [Asaia siamensis]GBR10109.1 large exoprotein [Asaia siamensis NRIC 0323]GGC32636.1 hypothetical protein GCM10007207_17660 [Asaia siamensis]
MTLTARILLLGFTALTPGLALAQALPSGGSFTAGSGSIASAGTAMTVTQSTARGVINWQGFSIASGHSVQFENGSGATLNRVTGAQMSELQGHLGATGSLYLINPNGIVIGPKGTVATGGSFVASTRDTTDRAFMKGGSLAFSGNSSGTVRNEGRITSTNGNVVLVGQSVSNSGTVNAANGTVALAAGNKVILSEAEGPDGIYVETDATAKGDVTNTGHIQAAAATLAAAGGNVYALAGNRDRLIQATGTRTVNGQIWLTAPQGKVTVEDTTVIATTRDGAGGTIRANGHEVGLGSRAVLDASATKSGKQGGHVLVGTDAMGGVNLATRTTIASGATLKARGKDNGAGGDIETSAHTMELGNATIDAGTGGQWLLDPTDLTIDANAAATINNTLASGNNVTQQTTANAASGYGTSSGSNGDIILNAPISWSTASTLTLSAYHSITLNAGITVTGNGTLALVTNNNSGGTSSGGTLALNGSAIQFPNRNTTANTGGAVTINGNAYTLIASTNDLQDIGTSGYYALAHPLDASAVSNFTPLGGSNGFAGDFNGLGNTISNLTISSNAKYVGLFGQVASGGTIENIGMIEESATGSASNSNVGTIAGSNYGLVSHVYATGADNTGVSSSSIGGLIGYNQGTISNAYSTGSVSASGNGSNIGGLVGTNYGTINNTYATTIVSGTASDAGGLVGYNLTTISNAYSTGSVSSVAAFSGGFVGYNFGEISGNFWDVSSSRMPGGVGGGGGSGLTGLTTAQLQSSLPVGFSALTWSNAGNRTTPYLLGLSGNQVFSVNDTAANLYTVVLNLPQLQAMQNNLAGRYVLGNAVDASGYTGFTPIGSGNSPFTGTLDGLGYTVNNLVISSGAYSVGLIGQLGTDTNVGNTNGVIKNIGMLGGSISGTGRSVGGLVGANLGSISHAYATGNVSASSADSSVGGLVGWNDGGTIDNAYATGKVTGTAEISAIGGLVGWNDGGTIINAYATGSVTGTAEGSAIGGLLGANNDSLITNVYGTGNVSSTGANSYIGGLAGYQRGQTTISNAYWDTTTTSQTLGVGAGSAGGATGLTTNEWLTKGPLANGNLNGFTDLSAWISGSPYPVLSALPYIVIKSNGATQVYGSSVISASGITYTDQSGADVNGRINGTITWQNAVLSKTSNAGSRGAIYGTGVTADGYQVTYAPAFDGINTNTITPAPLTITALNQNGVYGQTPMLGSTAFATSGLVNGDTVTGATLTSGATSASPAGSYAIAVSNAVGTGLANYAILYRSALLTISAPAPVVPEPVTPTPVTPAPVAPVAPEPVTPAPIIPMPVTPSPAVPEPVTPAPVTPPASVVALARIFWPTPVSAQANISFSGANNRASIPIAVSSSNSLASSTPFPEQIILAGGRSAYRITLPATSVTNQLRKAQ